MDIGKRVTLFRERAGISKYRLSQLTSVDPSLITRIERDEAKPSLDSLARICKALGISMGEFFSDNENTVLEITGKIKSLTEKLGKANEDIIDALQDEANLNFVKQEYLPVIRDYYVNVFGMDSEIVQAVDSISSRPIEDQVNFFARAIKDIQKKDNKLNFIAKSLSDADIELLNIFNELSLADQKLVLKIVAAFHER